MSNIWKKIIAIDRSKRDSPSSFIQIIPSVFALRQPASWQSHVTAGQLLLEKEQNSHEAAVVALETVNLGLKINIGFEIINFTSLTHSISTIVTDHEKTLLTLAGDEPNHEHETMSWYRSNAKRTEHGPSSNMQHYPSPSNLSRRDADIKHLVELLCDRMYWYMQRDKQDKNLKKMQVDLERCRPGYPESSNYTEVLKLQIDQCTKEKRKSCDRISGTDGKLSGFLTSFIDRQTGKLLSAHSNAVRSEEVDARLTAFQDSFDKKSRAYLAQITNDIQLQLRKETEGLTVALEQEREKNTRLQKHIEEMEQRLLNVEEKTPQNNRVTLEFDGKLTEFEQKLDQLSKKVDNEKMEVEEIVGQKVQPLYASLEGNWNGIMQEKLNMVAEKLGSFIDKERIAREDATTKANQSAAEVSALRRDVDVLKEMLNQKIGEQCKQIASWNERFAFLDRANLQKLELHLRTVNTWQRNEQDTTKNINNTVTSSTSRKKSSLPPRLETIEEHSNKSNADGTPKKRKALPK